MLELCSLECQEALVPHDPFFSPQSVESFPVDACFSLRQPFALLLHLRFEPSAFVSELIAHSGALGQTPIPSFLLCGELLPQVGIDSIRSLLPRRRIELDALCDESACG